MAAKRESRRYTAEAAAVRVSWLATADASAEAVGDWDVKVEAIASAVLAVVARGAKLSFGPGYGGGGVYVTVYDGDAKTARLCRDSVELDEFVFEIARAARGSRRPGVEE